MSLNNTKMSLSAIDSLFQGAKNIFFIGIGGVGMSALAQFCKESGKNVFGYDKTRTKITQELEKIGKIKYYSTPDNVSHMDMVIYTAAIDEHNYEYRRAKGLRLPLISRANFLGYVISLHKKGIGVCGMHGKSTTTALLTHIFEAAMKSPTAFCGAEMKEYGGGFKMGGRDFCIFEACEYKNSFHSLPTTDALVLNVDFDHPDFFGSLSEVLDSYKKYVSAANRAFINYDDKNAMSLCKENTVTFGFGEGADYRGEIIKSEGCPPKTTFLIYKSGVPIAACRLPMVGEHFVSDALGAFAVAHASGVPSEVICQSISTFKGNARRMEFIKKTDTGAHVYEDYAHHPQEAEATLSSLAQMGYKRILCIFQAHTYSRTYYLYDRFTKAFSQASSLIITPIFPAREENVFELSEEQFAADCQGEYMDTPTKIAHRVREIDCDCIVLMGAGDIGGKILSLL